MDADQDETREHQRGGRSRSVALGAGLGMVFGAAFGAVGTGMVLGAALGLTGILDRKLRD